MSAVNSKYGQQAIKSSFYQYMFYVKHFLNKDPFKQVDCFYQNSLWLSNFIINPKVRGLGLSSKFLELIANEAALLDFDFLMLDCEDQHLGVYEKAGFYALDIQFSPDKKVLVKEV